MIIPHGVHPCQRHVKNKNKFLVQVFLCSHMYVPFLRNYSDQILSLAKSISLTFIGTFVCMFRDLNPCMVSACSPVAISLAVAS